MQTEATNAEAAPESAQNYKFTHEARLPFVPDVHPRQRYFGPGSSAVSGLFNDRETARVVVWRWSGDERVARLEIVARQVNGFSAGVQVLLASHQLRELAARLIDAAADIERGEA